MVATLKITGIKELERAFKQLPKNVAKRVVRSALKKAMEPIAEDARHRAPKATGELERSIGLATARSSRTRAQIGVLVSATNPHAAAQEFGTEEQPGHAYMRPAFDSGAPLAARTIEEEIAAGIEWEAGRAARAFAAMERKIAAKARRKLRAEKKAARAQLKKLKADARAKFKKFKAKQKLKKVKPKKAKAK